MTPRYHMAWLRAQVASGISVKFLYFWGHTGLSHEKVGKFCFSQWFEYTFIVDTISYKTAEHWMMAQKALLFDDRAAFERIIACEKPGEAKALGRQVAEYSQQVWDEHKFQIVVQGNLNKFAQHSELAEYLIQTGDRILVEASPVDSIWGIGLAHDDQNILNIDHWPGQNLLGFALMEVRDILSKKGSSII